MCLKSKSDNRRRDSNIRAYKPGLRDFKGAVTVLEVGPEMTAKEQ
jgi:hypothetical protein